MEGQIEGEWVEVALSNRHVQQHSQTFHFSSRLRSYTVEQ